MGTEHFIPLSQQATRLLYFLSLSCSSSL